MADENPLALTTRTGWPQELRFILERYPRETWPDHINIQGMARFWLDIHASFRRAGAALRGSTDDFREGLVTPDKFRSRYAPRLETFLNHLTGHHQIEDYQMFPIFNAAEPRLMAGFDTLEKDHGVIHAAMDRMADAANAFMQIEAGDKDAMRRGADAYAATGDWLMNLLARHLDDEEDLVIPLILDRGEEELGL
ncbi:MAG: hemerythrin domain-containing protein [Bauldia sp.]